MTEDAQRASRLFAAGQTVLLFAFAAIVLLDRRGVLFVSTPAAIVGDVLCAAGLLLMFFAFASIKHVVQIEPEPRAGGELVTTGVYRFFRHPIYTGIIALAAGLFLRRPTALVAVAAALIVVFLIVKTRFEESRLLVRYPEYAGYRRRSWGVIPWLMP